jgi:hypothetical protein
LDDPSEQSKCRVVVVVVSVAVVVVCVVVGRGVVVDVEVGAGLGGCTPTKAAPGAAALAAEPGTSEGFSGLEERYVGLRDRVNSSLMPAALTRTRSVTTMHHRHPT